jgi:methionyl-tRNA synthetase
MAIVGLEWISPGLLIVVLIWSLIWKGMALWKSARHGQKVWYVILLIVNTIGILEILYLLLWQKNMERKVVKAKKAKKRRRR